MLDLTALLTQAVEIAKKAGDMTSSYFTQKDTINVQKKGDNTPLTEADLAANRVVVAGLQSLTPALPVLSEEGQLASFDERQQWSRYWLVDPLDGTRGFIDGCKEYTVNIALIDQHEPILGVVYAPQLNLCYYAAREHRAYKQSGAKPATVLQVKPITWPKLRIILGRYVRKTKLLQMYEAEPDSEVLRLNSSLKFCWIAEGKADVYPRLGETGEWDTAAGQCILTEAGGSVVNFADEALQYNLQSSVINPPFVALGDPSLAHRVIEFIEEKRRQL